MSRWLSVLSTVRVTGVRFYKCALGYRGLGGVLKTVSISHLRFFPKVISLRGKNATVSTTRKVSQVGEASVFSEN